MAGMGKRLRPHTITTPKPLVKVCEQEIVKILCKTIVDTCEGKVDKIGFVIGNFGQKVEAGLLEVAKSLGAEGRIYHQQEPLGTAHAVWCAKELLQGNTVVAFADTLFKADFVMDTNKDGIIWTSHVENPQQYGVVIKDDKGEKIVKFVEKPQDFISDEAIIGIYFFKKGELLYKEIERLIDNNIVKQGEYQLTDCLENMLQNNYTFTTEVVSEWLDCGNKNAVVHTNQRLLASGGRYCKISESLKKINSTIIEPCYIGENVRMENCVIGPYVSIEQGVVITNSIVKNSIIGANSHIKNVILDNAMIGESVLFEGRAEELSLGAYSNIEK